MFFQITAIAADYTVQPGDTLWLIAQKHNITAAE
ncbi:MAG: LysM peptidoglycan-binding domain-containing protein, partial [Clostridiales bacterium]|nr:LysM peptidoglycan-binding domain-containing protein [Clostridiales bacterium]